MFVCWNTLERMFCSSDKSSNKRMFCPCEKSSNACWNRTEMHSVNAFGPCVLPVRKLNSHGSERKEEWLCLDSLTDIPPDCLVDSLNDAGSSIVLLTSWKSIAGVALKLLRWPSSYTPSHGNGKNTHWLLTDVCIVHQKCETSGPYFQIKLILKMLWVTLAPWLSINI